MCQCNIRFVFNTFKYTRTHRKLGVFDGAVFHFGEEKKSEEKLVIKSREFEGKLIN